MPAKMTLVGKAEIGRGSGGGNAIPQLSACRVQPADDAVSMWGHANVAGEVATECFATQAGRQGDGANRIQAGTEFLQPGWRSDCRHIQWRRIKMICCRLQ